MEENKNLNNDVNSDNLEGTQTKPETKTYTDDQIQSMIDRRVSQALATAAKKSEKAIEQARKLASMDAAEREKEQFRLDREEFERQKAEFALMSNKVECVKVLSNKGLPAELADFVVAEDAETMNENIKVVEKCFLNAVKAEVEKRLNSSAPKKNLPINETISKDKFKKMGYSERMQLYTNNPDLYATLSK